MRDKSGLKYPLGKWHGWYFSEELKFAKENGYSITVLKGYNFNKEENVFDEYIQDVYKNKAFPVNKTQKAVAKSLLNNLLGRFGIDIDKAETTVVTTKEFFFMSMIHKIHQYFIISEKKVLVCYSRELDSEIIRDHGLDYLKVMSVYPDKEVQSLKITSVVISAAVTAYARIHISKLKLDIINKLGGQIYYSDTDSIVTDVELPANIVHPIELGKLKLEHKVIEGISLSGKLYAWRTNEDALGTNQDGKGKRVIILKGVNSTSLDFEKFYYLLHNIDVAGIKQHITTNCDRVCKYK